jgi:hypothetical protein
MRLTVTLALLGVAVPAVAGAEDWTLKVEGGSEYDSNVHRLEVPEEQRDEIVGAPLLRFGARLRGKTRPQRRHVFTYGLFGGGKMFLTDDAGDEDVAILAGNARYDVGLANRLAVAGVRASYYDAIGDDDFALSRNFSSGDVQGNLTLVGPGAHRISAHVGYRSFRYKPNRQFDFGGDHYGLRYTTTVWRGEGKVDASSFDFTASYQLGRRNYDSAAFANGCGADDEIIPDCFYPTSLDRVDLYHSAATELVYTGDRIYSARYELQVNDSNSVGQSLVRHRVEASVTSELFSEIFVTVKGIVQLNVFVDPLLLARDVNAQSFVSIDDENRNALVVHATRALWDRWAAEARYGLFTNEFATQELTFRRQTGYFGLVYTYGGR